MEKPDIAKMRNERDIKGLINALKYIEDNGTIRRRAAIALGEIGNSRAIESLIKHLKNMKYLANRNGVFLSAIIEALDKLGWNTANNEEKIIYLISKIISSSKEEMKEIYKSLDRASKELIIQALKNVDQDIRINAVFILGEIGDPRAVEPLVQALKDKNYNYRSRAVIILGKIGDPRAVEPLVQLLYEEGVWFEKNIVKALGKIGGPKAVESLIKALKDKDEYVRSEVIRALGEIGNPLAVEPLIQILKERNLASHDKKGIRNALEKLGKAIPVEVAATGKTHVPVAKQKLLDLIKSEYNNPKKQETVLTKIKERIIKIKEFIRFLESIPVYKIQIKGLVTGTVIDYGFAGEKLSVKGMSLADISELIAVHFRKCVVCGAKENENINLIKDYMSASAKYHQGYKPWTINDKLFYNIDMKCNKIKEMKEKTIDPKELNLAYNELCLYKIERKKPKKNIFRSSSGSKYGILINYGIHCDMELSQGKQTTSTHTIYTLNKELAELIKNYVSDKNPIMSKKTLYDEYTLNCKPQRFTCLENRLQWF